MICHQQNRFQESVQIDNQKNRVTGSLVHLYLLTSLTRILICSHFQCRCLLNDVDYSQEERRPNTLQIRYSESNSRGDICILDTGKRLSPLDDKNT